MIILGKDIPLGEKFRIEESEAKVVSDEGVALIRNLLRNEADVRLPSNFEFSIGRGTRITRRVSKSIHDDYSISLASQVLERIGNIAKEHSQSYGSVDVDFVNEFRWRDGDFGDRGSCFWGGRGQVRLDMEKAGFLAVRLYSVAGIETVYCECASCKRLPEEKRLVRSQGAKPAAGIGRAWFKPVDEETIVMFNGYGKFGLLGIVLTILPLFRARYQKVELSNFGVTTGPLYINGGSGYALSIKKAKIFTSFDFETSEVFTKCDCCGEGMPGGTYWNGRRRRNDVALCKKCYRASRRCSACSEVRYAGEKTRGWKRYKRDGREDERDCCPSCAKRYFRLCGMCGKDTYHYDLWKVGGKEVCGPCTREHYDKCRECGGFHDKGSLKGRVKIASEESVIVCDRCVSKKCVTCVDCNKLVFLHHTDRLSRGRVCYTCVDEAREKRRRERGDDPPMYFDAFNDTTFNAREAFGRLQDEMRGPRWFAPNHELAAPTINFRHDYDTLPSAPPDPDEA